MHKTKRRDSFPNCRRKESDQKYLAMVNTVVHNMIDASKQQKNMSMISKWY